MTDDQTSPLRAPEAGAAAPCPARLWHACSLEATVEALGSSADGLTEAEAARRLRDLGPNELAERAGPAPIVMFLRQFHSVLVYVLLGAVVVSVVVNEKFDAYVITVIVVLNAVLGFFQEYRAEQAVAALRKLAQPTATVIRGGRPQSVPTRELVPGDLVHLEEGDYVPADGRLLQVTRLQTDEAALTGESAPAEKQLDLLPADADLIERTNMVYLGTVVTAGRGHAIVVATGIATEMGAIAGEVQTAREGPTTLQVKLEKLAQGLALFTAVVCALVFVVGGLQSRHWLEMLMLALSLAVAAIPEGLPAVITVCLAIGVQQMARRHAVVRRLAAGETLGCASVLCTDKTGTITRNEMTVTRVRIGGTELTVTGSGYAPEGRFEAAGEPVSLGSHTALRRLLEIGVLCNHARLHRAEGTGDTSPPRSGRPREETSWEVFGDPTEAALLVAAAKAGIVREELEQRLPRVDEAPFDSARKRMTTVHQLASGRLLVCTKGAPEAVVPRCTRWLDEHGERTLGEQTVADIRAADTRLAGEALRLLAFAYREVRSEELPTDITALEQDLTFVGVVGLMDPPKAEVAPALERCREAGVRVVMITGDHQVTAAAVARQIGLSDDGRALTGRDLDGMSDEALGRALEEVNVFARVAPGHKSRILRQLQAAGHVVGMTGDGVNDAPAVKQADIGIAMARKGTDVTREVAQLILTDDNFASIVAAVEQGRIVYDNIRKFVRFLLSANFGEILIVLFATALNWDLPLLPIQILWVNLVTDGLPALALATNPPEPDVMQRPPRNPRENMLPGMLRFLLVCGVVSAVATLGGFWLERRELHDNPDTARTMALTVLVLFEMCLAFNCQSDRGGIFTARPMNWRLLGAVLLTVGLQVAVTYIPFTQRALRLAPLDWDHWGRALLLGATGLLLSPRWLRLGAPAPTGARTASPPPAGEGSRRRRG